MSRTAGPDDRRHKVEPSTDRLLRIVNRLRLLPPGRAAALVILGMVLIGAIDWFTGPDLSLLIGYAAVIGFAGWVLSGPLAVVLALTAALTTALVALGHPEAWVPTTTVTINTIFRAVFLATFGAGSAGLRRVLLELDDVARTDPLTGLLNRRAVFDLLSAEAERSRRTGRPVTVAFFDLDGLKVVNDSEGHDAGDEMITRFAAGLASGVRAIDRVARVGGDEFVVLLPETDAPAAEAVLGRLYEVVGLPASSCGAVTWEVPPATADEMVNAADSAMYEVKGTDRRFTVQRRPIATSA